MGLFTRDRRRLDESIEFVTAEPILLAANQINGPATMGGRLLFGAGRAAAKLLAAATLFLAANLGREQLEKMNADALAKRDYLVAVLSRFRLDLHEGEKHRVFLPSRK